MTGRNVGPARPIKNGCLAKAKTVLIIDGGEPLT
jgi:hypothetical protein